MLIRQGTFSFGKHTLYVNAFHVHIDGKPWRSPEMPEWYDEKHRKVTEALEALERALEEAVEGGA